MASFFTSNLINHDRVHRHFAYLIAIIVGLTILFTLLKPITTPPLPFAIPPLTWGSPLCTAWTALILLVVTAQAKAESEQRHVTSEVLKLASQAVLMLVVLIFYEGSNVVQRHRYSLFGDKMLYDSHLLRLDDAVLGWLCPQGQLALCLDTHPLIGVKTLFGAVLAEVLQLMYVSYYFWGNCLGGWLAYQYFIVTQLWKQHNSVGHRRRQWRLIQMYVTAWVGGFLANFILNMIFPAVSPRIHIRLQYVNEIRGFWLADSLRSAIQGAAANTFSAFPSGHCGLSWLVPIFAHRMGYPRYRLVTIVAAILISSATLIMRYHYFADFLFSIAVVYFAAWFGGFHTQRCYSESLRGDERDRAKDNKGRRYEEDGEEEEASEEDDHEAASRVPLMEVTVDRGGSGSAPQSSGGAGRGEVASGVGLPSSLTLGGVAGLNGGGAAAAGLTAGGTAHKGLSPVDDAMGGEDGEGSDADAGPPPVSVPAQVRLPRGVSGELMRLSSNGGSGSGAMSRQSTGDHKLASTRE